MGDAVAARSWSGWIGRTMRLIFGVTMITGAPPARMIATPILAALYAYVGPAGSDRIDRGPRDPGKL